MRVYQEELMDHYKYPRNKKKIEAADFTAGEHNPSCGDKIYIEGKISGNTVTDIGFDGAGCVISQASASMLTEHCMNKTIDEILLLSKDDMIKLIGFELGPTRLRCAMLALHVLQQGLKKIKEK